MVGALERVMVCSPRTAGWNQPEHAALAGTGLPSRARFRKAQSQHEALCRELRRRVPRSSKCLPLPIFPSMPSIPMMPRFPPITVSSSCVPASRTASPKARTTPHSARLWTSPRSANHRSRHHRSRRHRLARFQNSADRPRLPHQRRRHSADARICSRPKASKFFPRRCPTAPAHPPACI